MWQSLFLIFFMSGLGHFARGTALDPFSQVPSAAPRQWTSQFIKRHPFALINKRLLLRFYTELAELMRTSEAESTRGETTEIEKSVMNSALEIIRDRARLRKIFVSTEIVLEMFRIPLLNAPEKSLIQIKSALANIPPLSYPKWITDDERLSDRAVLWSVLSLLAVSLLQENIHDYHPGHFLWFTESKLWPFLGALCGGLVVGADYLITNFEYRRANHIRLKACSKVWALGP